MRSLTDTLKNAQQAATINVIYKIVLTKGASSYTYEQDRILPSEHDEETYSHRATIVLDNSDGEFDAKDLKGFKGVISYGAVTGSGNEYSATSPVFVIDQQFNSIPGRLTCELELEGMPNLMAQDEASENYVPEEDDTETVKTLVNAIVGATLSCFSHCKAFDVVWDSGYDSLADSYKPKDSFRIYTGVSRLAVLRGLLDYTANVMRFEHDGKVHVLKPVTTGLIYDYEYNLQSGHTFFSKAYRNSLVFPNRVVVQSRKDDDPQYSGSAQTDNYASLPDEVKKTKYFQTRLESVSQAEDIAEAMIAKTEMWSERGAAEVPINVGAEVFDYVKLTDQRQGDSRTGNLGYIHRKFGQGEWSMTFGFGNWLSVLRYQNMLKELETYTDAGQYFSRLQVGDLYAERILADSIDMVWLDPEGNIDLSQIGDSLDNLPDGEVYARVKTLHLDAGQVKLDENVLYALNYDPTAKFDPSHDSLDDIPEGVIYQRAKSAALTADGLVILDQVVIGTYGLVLSTDISAGHIRLSSVEQSVNYRTSSDTEKTTWNGKEVAIHRGTTAPTDKTKLWVDTSVTPNVWKRWTGTAWVKCTPTELDEIADGATYARVLKTDIWDGHIKLSAAIEDATHRLTTDSEQAAWDAKPEDMDEIDMGVNWSKPRSDQITAYGYLNLNANTYKDGEWYNESGVEIDAAHGINIYGVNQAFTTRATKTGAIQCYVGSDGKIYAGAGAVSLDSDGLTIEGEMTIYKNTSGTTRGYVHVVGQELVVQSVDTHLILRAPGSYGIKMEGLDAYLYLPLSAQGSYTNHLYDIHCYNSTTWLGESGLKFARGYFTDLPACPVPTTNTALDVIKKIAPPQVRDGERGVRHYFMDDDFPSEMKIKKAHKDKEGNVIEEDEEEIEFVRTIGILVQSVRELTGKVEAIEARQS